MFFLRLSSLVFYSAALPREGMVTSSFDTEQEAEFAVHI
jgi:hypothetical protein